MSLFVNKVHDNYLLCSYLQNVHFVSVVRAELVPSPRELVCRSPLFLSTKETTTVRDDRNVRATSTD